ncbi:MAG TPA: GNAT family N-acetyltransferase [Ktedonobacteraceae bacterium]|jgi:GNAT superfamily N-acetyltransferase
MHEQALTITIKPAEEAQLDALERVFFPETRSKYHSICYEVQERGEGVYLIAWHDHVPVGHFLIRWSGPDDTRVTSHIDVTRSAYLQAGRTQAEYRRKGIATALIREAERLAREKGCTQIGLSVGSTDNPTAKRLYEHLGYVDWGRGDFLISWEYIDRNGNTRMESEMVTYMHKPL